VGRSLAVAVVLALSTAAAAQSVSIQLEGNTFKALGTSAGRLTVYAGTGDVPALAGTTAVENGDVVFLPKFPLSAGVRYRAVFVAPNGATTERTFDGPPRPSTPTTRVEHIYPSSDVLPSNQLRLYIYFSAPMSRGEAEQRIHVLDDRGRPLQGVFLPGQELWDPQNRRLTMTFDPGRIKRDLVSNRSMGPPIAEGKQYTLVVDRDWHDAKGVALVDSFRKPFRGGPAVRQPPDPKTWSIAAPTAGSQAPLVVDFRRPMNYPLLQRMLKISGKGGEIAGGIDVGRNETEWRFTPRQPWTAGRYSLVVDTSLEDLAGNRVGQPFDIDVFDKVTERITTTTTSISFEIRAAR
jgi:hypothetical protein